MSAPAIGGLSIAKLGRTTIQIDVPTHRRLKALAERKGMAFVEFMRWIADQGGDVQGKILPGDVDTVMARRQQIDSVGIQAVDILKVLPEDNPEQRDWKRGVLYVINALKKRQDIEGLQKILSQLEDTLEQAVVKQKALEAGQLELSGGVMA